MFLHIWMKRYVGKLKIFVVFFLLQGHPRLVNVLAKLYSPLTGQTLDPMNNITVSVGAYGVLFCAVQGLVNPGDEVRIS